jgi:hypothetical protein
LINYFGRGSLFAGMYHKQLHDLFEKQKEERKAKLIENLRHSEVECEEGLTQVKQFDTKFGKIQRVLLRKLNEGELTYSRYLGSAEDVYSSGLKNLEQVVTLRFSMDDKNIDSDRETVRRLTRKKNSATGLTDAESRKLAAAEESVRIYDRSAHDVEDLLAQNEEGLTALDKASAAIAKIDAGGEASALEFALTDLMQLATRADRNKVVEVNLGKQ